MRISWLWVGLMISAQMTPALAQTQDTPPAPASSVPTTVQTSQKMTAVQVDSEVPVCRSTVSTGTRFAHRECHTAFEWRQMCKDASDYVKYIQQRANSYCLGVC